MMQENKNFKLFSSIAVSLSEQMKETANVLMLHLADPITLPFLCNFLHINILFYTCACCKWDLKGKITEFTQ